VYICACVCLVYCNKGFSFVLVVRQQLLLRCVHLSHSLTFSLSLSLGGKAAAAAANEIRTYVQKFSNSRP